MSIQSGELVTILGVRRYIKFRFFKSLRFYIILLLMLVGIIPCVVMKAMVLESYEKRAVDITDCRDTKSMYDSMQSAWRIPLPGKWGVRDYPVRIDTAFQYI